jgi:dTDP-4-amino-4,6-dideoxygalactose transaminase
LIPHSRPTLDADDAERVARVVRGGHVAQGAEVEAFERELAARLGVAATAVVSSGSAALELALRVLDVGAGDEVLVPSYACDALHHCVTRCGATPVLVDADPATLSLSVDDAGRRLTGRTRAVVVHHAFGLGVDLDGFTALGVPIVEDCAQALGAIVDGRPVGARGRAAVGSFYATKMLTTGEGGVLGGPADLVARARDLRDYDEHVDLVPRFNYKMTDMQAALGRGQLARLDTFLARRRAIAGAYRERLAATPCRVPPDAGARHVFHRFVAQVDAPVEGVLARMAAAGVAARRPVFRPLHRARGLSGFPHAERLWATCVSLPCYPALTDPEVDTVATAFRGALS